MSDNLPAVVVDELTDLMRAVTRAPLARVTDDISDLRRMSDDLDSALDEMRASASETAAGVQAATLVSAELRERLAAIEARDVVARVETLDARVGDLRADIVARFTDSETVNDRLDELSEAARDAGAAIDSKASAEALERVATALTSVQHALDLEAQARGQLQERVGDLRDEVVSRDPHEQLIQFREQLTELRARVAAADPALEAGRAERLRGRLLTAVERLCG